MLALAGEECAFVLAPSYLRLVFSNIATGQGKVTFRAGTAKSWLAIGISIVPETLGINDLFLTTHINVISEDLSIAVASLIFRRLPWTREPHDREPLTERLRHHLVQMAVFEDGRAMGVFEDDRVMDEASC